MNPTWKITSRVEDIAPSATLAIDARAKALIREGVEVVNFSAGEPDFDTPAVISEAAMTALRGGQTHYAPAAGLPELREALASKYAEEYSLDYTPAQTMVCNGTKQALFNALAFLVNPGDEVLLLSPYWVSYTEMVGFFQGKPVIVPTDSNSRPDPALLEKSITPATRGILLNTPNNPSGCVYSREELKAIADLASKHDLWILSDEVYEKLTYPGFHHTSPAQVSADAKERTIIVNAFSKSFAMTGWRVGFLIGPEKSVKAASKLQGHATGNVNTPAMHGALKALELGEEAYRPMLREYEVRRTVMAQGLDGIGGISCPEPQGAFYAFADVAEILKRSWKGKSIETSMRLCEILLEECHVACVPGSAFGTEGKIRLSFATSEDQIRKGIGRIGEFVQGLS